MHAESTHRKAEQNGVSMNESMLGSYDCSALMVIVSARKEKLLWGRISVGYQPESLTTAFNRMPESYWDINRKVLKVIRILSLLGMGATKNRSNSRSITAHEICHHTWESWGRYLLTPNFLVRKILLPRAPLPTTQWLPRLSFSASISPIFDPHEINLAPERVYPVRVNMYL